MANKKPEIDLDINNIFYMLHEQAKKEAESVNTNIVVANIGVNVKNKTFIGPGEFMLIAKAKEETMEIKKSEYFKVLKTYIEFFCGKEVSDKITEDQLKEITTDNNTQTESQQIDYTRSLLETLFVEDDEPHETQIIGYTITYDVTVSDKTSPPPSPFKKSIANAAKNYGWPLFTGIIKGAYNIAGGILDGIFNSGMFKDLKGIKLKTYGSGEIGIDKAVDAAISAGKATTNAVVKVTQDVGKMIKTAYLAYKKHFSKKDMSAISTVLAEQILKEHRSTKMTVGIYNTELLIRNLKQQKKYDISIADKIDSQTKSTATRGSVLELFAKLKYIIGVTIPHNDPHYGSFNEKMLVNDFNKAYSKFEDLYFGNGIKLSNVVKITNFNPNSSINNSTKESVDKIQNQLMSMLFESLLIEAVDKTIHEKLIDYLSNLSKESLEKTLEKFKNDSTVSDSEIENVGHAVHIHNKDELVDKIKNAYDTNTISSFFNTEYDHTLASPDGEKNKAAVKKIYLSMNDFADKIATLLSDKTSSSARELLSKLYSSNLTNSDIKTTGVDSVRQLVEILKTIASESNDKDKYKTELNTIYKDDLEKLEKIYSTLFKIQLDKKSQASSNEKFDFFAIIKSGLAFNETDTEQQTNNEK